MEIDLQLNHLDNESAPTIFVDQDENTTMLTFRRDWLDLTVFLGPKQVAYLAGKLPQPNEVCTMCVSTKRGPTRIASDTIGDISAQYLQLEDGSGIGMNEADLFLRGFREGMKRAAGIAYGASNGLVDTPAKEPYVMTVYEAICKELE